MRALIVYTSWFGHTRLVAETLANELSALGFTVVCAHADQVTPSEAMGCSVLLLGTHSHLGNASHRLVEMVETIPYRRLSRIALGVFGVSEHSPDAIDQLAMLCEERGCAPLLPPLRIERHGMALFTPETALNHNDLVSVQAFAAEIAEALEPVVIG